jgi:hypothetical protein
MDSLYISYDQKTKSNGTTKDDKPDTQESVSSPKPIQPQLISFEAPE